MRGTHAPARGQYDSHARATEIDGVVLRAADRQVLKYQIVAGHNRSWAVASAGNAVVTRVHVHTVLDDYEGRHFHCNRVCLSALHVNAIQREIGRVRDCDVGHPGSAAQQRDSLRNRSRNGVDDQRRRICARCSVHGVAWEDQPQRRCEITWSRE